MNHPHYYGYGGLPPPPMRHPMPPAYSGHPSYPPYPMYPPPDLPPQHMPMEAPMQEMPRKRAMQAQGVQPLKRRRQERASTASPPPQTVNFPKSAAKSLEGASSSVKEALAKVLSEMYIPGVSAPEAGEEEIPTDAEETSDPLECKSPDAMFWQLFKSWQPPQAAPSGKDPKTLAKLYMQAFHALRQSFEAETSGRMPLPLMNRVCGVPVLASCQDLRDELTAFRAQGVSLAAIGRAIDVHYASLQKFTRTRGTLGGFRQRACLELWKFFEIKRRWEGGKKSKWHQEAERAWDSEMKWVEKKAQDGVRLIQDKNGQYYPRFPQVWGSESAFNSAQKLLVPQGTVPILTPAGYKVVPEHGSKPSSQPKTPGK